jgi:Ribophorin I
LQVTTKYTLSGAEAQDKYTFLLPLSRLDRLSYLQSNVNGRKVSSIDCLHCLRIDASIILADVFYSANVFVKLVLKILPCCCLPQQTPYERVEDIDGFAAYRVQLTAPTAGDIKVLTYALYTDVLKPYPKAITQMDQQYMVRYISYKLYKLYTYNSSNVIYLCIYLCSSCIACSQAGLLAAQVDYAY